MTRDTQRQKLYDAQHEIPAGADLKTVAAVHEYLERIIATDWFQQRWPHITKPPRIADGRGTRFARGGDGYMNLPRWARTERTVLHELAHNLQAPGTAWHGPEYARILLELVLRFMGAEPAIQLRGAFRQHRVRIASAAASTPSLSAAQARELRQVRKEITELQAQLDAKVARARELRRGDVGKETLPRLP